MVGIAQMVTEVMKFKHPTPAQYAKMSAARKRAYHTKAADLYKRYAKFFSGKVHKELMKKHRHHKRLSPSIDK